MDPRQPATPDEPDDNGWRAILTGSDPGLARTRSMFMRLPSNPRCKMCAAPFGGPVGRIMRIAWHAPLTRNPLLCRACGSQLKRHPGGAEIEISVLFADVRGSTGLAEGTSPVEFRNRLQAFYRVAWNAINDQDGFVDKYLGDGIMALFIPLIAGERHAERAVAAGRKLIAGMAPVSEARLPVGVGIHTGTAYVGVVGTEGDMDFSALGDVVNVAARLGSVADAGELLVSAESARAAGIEISEGRGRLLEIRGRHEPLEVVTLEEETRSAMTEDATMTHGGS